MKPSNRHTHPRIPLYAVRTMSEKINATFDFVKENWRVWLRLSFYVLLPVSIIQGMGMNNIISSLFSNGATPYFGITVTMIFSLVGISLDTALVLVLLKWYDTHDDGLESVSFRTIWPDLRKYFWKTLLAWIVAPFLFIPGMLVSTTLSLIIPVVFLLYIAAMLPILIIPPIYIYERLSYFKSVKKAFKMGYSRWGSLIGIVFSIWITIFALQGICTIPWYVSLGLKAYLEGGSPEWSYAWKVFVDLMAYVMTIVQCFTSYLGMAFVTFSTTYHYTSVATEIDAATIDSEIEDFANI